MIFVVLRRWPPFSHFLFARPLKRWILAFIPQLQQGTSHKVSPSWDRHSFSRFSAALLHFPEHPLKPEKKSPERAQTSAELPRTPWPPFKQLLLSPLLTVIRIRYERILFATLPTGAGCHVTSLAEVIHQILTPWKPPLIRSSAR